MILCISPDMTDSVSQPLPVSWLARPPLSIRDFFVYRSIQIMTTYGSPVEPQPAPSSQLAAPRVAPLVVITPSVRKTFQKQYPTAYLAPKQERRSPFPECLASTNHLARGDRPLPPRVSTLHATFVKPGDFFFHPPLRTSRSFPFLLLFSLYFYLPVFPYCEGDPLLLPSPSSHRGEKH